MSSKSFLTLCISILCITSAFVFTSSCSKTSDSPDYDWMYTSVQTTPITNFNANRFVTSETLNPPKGALFSPLLFFIRPDDRFLVSGLAFLDNNRIVAAFRDTASAYISRLEIIDCFPGGGTSGGWVLAFAGGIEFPEARINNVTTDNANRVFVALDTKNGPVLVSFDASTTTAFTQSTALNGVRLNGSSANGLFLSQESDGEYLYSTTSGNAAAAEQLKDTVLNFDGQTAIAQSDFAAQGGFQKTKVSGISLKPISYQGSKNSRGRWIAQADASMVTFQLTPSGNAWQASVQYYDTYIRDFKNSQLQQNLVGGIRDYLSKNVCLMNSGNQEKFLYLCAADKGFITYKITPSGTNAGFAEVHKFDVQTYGACLASDGKLYLACGTKGIQVLNGQAGNYQAEKYLKPDYYLRENGSANFIIERNGTLYVAYGKDGVMSVPSSDPCFSTGSLN